MLNTIKLSLLLVFCYQNPSLALGCPLNVDDCSWMPYELRTPNSCHKVFDTNEAFDLKNATSVRNFCQKIGQLKCETDLLDVVDVKNDSTLPSLSTAEWYLAKKEDNFCRLEYIDGSWKCNDHIDETDLKFKFICESCKDEEKIGTTTTTTTTPNTTTEKVDTGVGVGVPKCDCGRLPEKDRIVGDTEYDQPWAVYLKNKDTDKLQCVATIIDKRHLITINGCYDASDRNIIVGKFDTTVSGECTGANHTMVDHIHPTNTNGKFAYLEIIELDRDIVFSKNVRPVCMPDSPSENYVGQEATISGWGHTSKDVKKDSTTLRVVSVPVISNQECNTMTTTYKAESFIICGYSDNKGPCVNEIGAPFVVNDTLIGVYTGKNGKSQDCVGEKDPFLNYRITEALPNYIEKFFGGATCRKKNSI